MKPLKTFSILQALAICIFSQLSFAETLKGREIICNWVNHNGLQFTLSLGAEQPHSGLTGYSAEVEVRPLGGGLVLFGDKVGNGKIYQYRDEATQSQALQYQPSNGHSVVFQIEGTFDALAKGSTVDGKLYVAELNLNPEYTRSYELLKEIETLDLRCSVGE